VQRALVLVLACLAIAVGARTLRVEATATLLSHQRYEDLYYVPPPAWLKVFSLGHDEALADLLWVRALVYFGDELTERGQVRHALKYTEAIVTLDPDFKRAYRWAGVAGMYKPVEVSPEEIREAIAFLERGAARFPNDGELAWELGASYAFELAPRLTDPAEKEHARRSGVEYMQIAARLGAGPDWLVFTNMNQLMRLGETEQAIAHLEEMYSIVDDDATRQQIARELEALRNRAEAEGLEEAWQDLEERRLRELPYVDRGLFMLLDSVRDRDAE
jgi:tetratricopeptide (TPR) repeat protein